MLQNHKFKREDANSFDQNLQQIERTNKLLNNIENKLNDFFNKNLASKSYNHDTTSTAYTHILTEPMDFRIPTIADSFVSPQNHNHTKDNHSSYDKFKNKDNSFGSDSDKLKLDDKQSINGVKKSSYNTYIPRSATGSGVTCEDFIDLLTNKKRTPITEQSTSEIKTEISQKTFLGDDKQPIELFFQPNDHILLKNDQEMPKELFKQGDNLLDKMDKLEKFYQEKIKILEERLKSSEGEIKVGIMTNQKLNDENVLLKKEITELKGKYSDNFKKKLHEVEILYGEKLQTQAKIKEKEINELKKCNDELSQTIKNLSNENQKLADEIRKLKNNMQICLEEKKAVSKSFQNLLKINNRMVELDLNKNQKYINLSINQTNEKVNDSIQKQEMIDAVKNSKYMIMEELKDDIYDDRNNDSNIINLLEIFKKYKEELEYLKENNNNIKVQFTQEISKLNQILKAQEVLNLELIEKVYQQNEELKNARAKSNSKDKNISILTLANTNSQPKLSKSINEYNDDEIMEIDPSLETFNPRNDSNSNRKEFRNNDKTIEAITYQPLQEKFKSNIEHNQISHPNLRYYGSRFEEKNENNDNNNNNAIKPKKSYDESPSKNKIYNDILSFGMDQDTYNLISKPSLDDNQKDLPLITNQNHPNNGKNNLIKKKKQELIKILGNSMHQTQGIINNKISLSGTFAHSNTTETNPDIMNGMYSLDNIGSILTKSKNDLIKIDENTSIKQQHHKYKINPNDSFHEIDMELKKLKDMTDNQRSPIYNKIENKLKIKSKQENKILKGSKSNISGKICELAKNYMPKSKQK